MTEQPDRPMTWSVCGRSFMGAAHRHHGMPNQDAIAWAPRESQGAAAILALADGHGASVHFRSGIGAHLAVEVATAVLQEAIADPSWIAGKDTSHARTLSHEVVRRWRAAVHAHVATNPLQMPPGKTGTTLTPYGATLLAAAATSEGIFVLQIGDGDLLLAGSDGTVLRPLPNDTGMIGEQTYSLCQESAEDYLRTRIIPRAEADIDLAVLATDGMAKSFAGADAAETLAAAWRASIAREELPAVLRRLDAWLPEVSRRGSGDDITMGFLIRSDMVDRPAHAAPPEWPNPVPRTVVRAIAPVSRRGGLLSPTWMLTLAGLLSAAAGLGFYLLR